MRQRPPLSFDELIRNRYGAKAADDPRFALRVEDLFASYYGVPSTSQPPQGSKATSVVLSRTDDGETLRQRGARGRQRSDTCALRAVRGAAVAVRLAAPQTAANTSRAAPPRRSRLWRGSSR